MKAAGQLLLCGVFESSETFMALENQGGAMQGDAEGIWSQDEFVAEEADGSTIRGSAFVGWRAISICNEEPNARRPSWKCEPHS